MVAVGTVAVAVVPSVNGDAITIAVSPAANPGNTNVVSAAPLIMVLIAADISTGVPGIVSVWAAAGVSTALGDSIVGVVAVICGIGDAAGGGLRRRSSSSAIKSLTICSVSRHAVPLPMAMIDVWCLRMSCSSFFFASATFFCGGCG